MPRLFVAITMPSEVTDALDGLCHGLPEARWTDLDDLHLTLRFIGEVDHNTFYDVGEMLAGVELPPFDLTLRGLGQFPPRASLRQLWVGVEPNASLDRLRRRVEKHVTEVGVPPDRRKFVPHITIARFRQPPTELRLQRYLQRHSLFRSMAFPVSSFELYSSLLRADGAEHVLEAEYDFVAGIMTRH